MASSTTRQDDDPADELPGDLPTGSDVAVRPLPGDGWSDEARTVFVADCSAGFAPNAALGGADPVALCERLYDDASATQDFAEFSEMWSSDDFDPDSPMGRYVTTATLSCLTSTMDG